MGSLPTKEDSVETDSVVTVHQVLPLSVARTPSLDGVPRAESVHSSQDSRNYSQAGGPGVTGKPRYHLTGRKSDTARLSI